MHSVARTALHGHTHDNKSTVGPYKVITSSQSLLMVQLPPQQTIQALGGSLRRSVMILPHIGSHTSVHSVVRLALHGPTHGNTSKAGLYKVVTSSQSLLIVQFPPQQSHPDLRWFLGPRCDSA